MRPSAERFPLVVLYHGFYPVVDPSDPFLSRQLSYQRLDRHLQMLRANYRMINEEEFLELAAHNFRHANETCLVTVDDGYGCLAQRQLQELFEAHRVRPALFVVAGYLEGELFPWYITLTMLLRRARGRIFYRGRLWDFSDSLHRKLLFQKMERIFLQKPAAVAQECLRELIRVTEVSPEPLDPDLAPLRWEDCTALLKRGWSIGSHGWSHHPLAQLPEAEIQQELTLSKQRIEQRLGIAVRTVSYPNGSHNALVRRYAAQQYECGFAVSTEVPTDRFQIRRVEFGADPFHPYLQYRPKHPGVQQFARAMEARWRGHVWRAGASLAQWVLRSAWKRNGLLPLRQALVRRRWLEPKPVIFAVSKSRREQAPQAHPRVAVLTGTHPWQRYAVSRLSEQLNLVGVIIERQTPAPFFLCRCNGAERWLGQVGPRPDLRPWLRLGEHPERTVFDFHLACGWEVFCVAPSTEALFLPEGGSVNDSAAADALARWRPDYLFCFGTSRVEKGIWSLAARVAVNLHWGLSPYYRGSNTLWWPLFEERPEYVGGTLHVLDDNLDGGAIFVQWQPRVDGSESPHELELMITRTGVEHAIRLISALHHGRRVQPVPQPSGLGAFYAKADFTPEVANAVKAKLNAGLLARFAKQQEVLQSQVKLFTSPDWVTVCTLPIQPA